MMNLIYSELYKVMRRKSGKIVFLVLAFLAFFYNFYLREYVDYSSLASYYGVDINRTWEFWVQTLTTIGLFITLFIVQLVHANEPKVGTLKNTVAFGLDRKKVYLSRLITELLLMLLAEVVLLPLLYVSNIIAFGMPIEIVNKIIWMNMFCLTFLWMACLSLAHFLAMVCNSNSLGIVIYFSYFLFIDKIIGVVREYLIDGFLFDKLAEMEVMSVLSQLGGFHTMINRDTMILSVKSGLFYMGIFTVVGVWLYQKKELK